MASRLALAEVQIERSKVVMESLAGFCHALGQPAQVLLSSIELLKMPGTDPELQKQVLEICYDAAVEIRSLLAQLAGTQNQVLNPIRLLLITRGCSAHNGRPWKQVPH